MRSVIRDNHALSWGMHHLMLFMLGDFQSIDTFIYDIMGKLKPTKPAVLMGVFWGFFQQSEGGYDFDRKTRYKVLTKCACVVNLHML